jgi:cytochrome P450
VKFTAYDVAVYRLSPLLHRFIHHVIPAEIAEGQARHINLSKAKILARMKKEQDGSLERKDFCSYIFNKREELKITDWEMAAHSNALIVAGSETTATILSGMTYWLCRTPDVYAKLKHEIRSKFRSADEITSTTATLPYMTAVINETLRIYPPISVGMPRVVPPGGETVAGSFIPGGVSFYAPRFIFDPH